MSDDQIETAREDPGRSPGPAQPVAATAPTYRYTMLPSGMVGPNALTCEVCGALVLDTDLHDEWHAAQNGRSEP